MCSIRRILQKFLRNLAEFQRIFAEFRRNVDRLSVGVAADKVRKTTGAGKGQRESCPYPSPSIHLRPAPPFRYTVHNNASESERMTLSTPMRPTLPAAPPLPVASLAAGFGDVINSCEFYWRLVILAELSPFELFSSQ